MANYRGGRINEEVKREISVIIRDEIKDPRMTAMVSITAVKVTKDLRYAKVFVSIFGNNEEEKNETFAALKSASGYIRKEIGQRINLRNTPQILFELDDSISYSMKIE
jgi:ribosome-binding factor A